MFDRYDCSHTVTDIRPGKIRILFFQNSKFSCILVDCCRKRRLESGQMRSSLCIIDIIAETKHIFMELIDILESHLNFDAFCFPFEIHRIMHDFFFVIQFADESKDSIRLMINDLFRLRSPLIFEHDLKIRVQIRCLMKPAFYLVCFELCLFKYGIIRKEIHLRSGLSCLSDRRQ